MILVNLLPENLRLSGESKWKFLQNPLIKGVLSIVVLFLAGQIFLTIFAGYRFAELGLVKKQVADLTEMSKGLSARKTQIADLNLKLKAIDALTQRTFFWSSFLNGMNQCLTKGIWLTGFSIGDGPTSGAVGRDKKPSKPAKVLKLEGSAVAPPGQETAYVARFIKELKSGLVLGELFEKAELLTINQKRIKDVDVYDFVVNCTFKKDKF